MFIFPFITATSAVEYFVDMAPIDNSNVYGKVDTPYVTDLGVTNNPEQCSTLCATNITTPINNRCQSFTWFDTSYYVSSMRKHCYGVMGKQYGSVWTYVTDKGGQPGRIIYPCIDNTDCSLNGKCSKNTGNCTCNPGWTGYHCGLINFDKATKTAGYYYPNNISSWGMSLYIILCNLCTL